MSIHLEEELLNELIQCNDNHNIILSNNNRNSNNDISEDSANSLDISATKYERNPIDNENDFKRDLQEWAIKFNIPHNALNALLLVLNKYTSCTFSKDSRSLLHTPRSTNIVPIGGGHYYHFGLKRAVQALLKNRKNITNNENICLLINIDGLPLSKNIEGLNFWPILCSLSDNISKQVYIVGCFCGKGKPTHVEEFLRPFVDEAVELSRNGFLYNNIQVKVCISALICDAPAAAYVLSVKQHTDYNSCRKCTVRGEWIESKVCFPGSLQNALRTNNEFANEEYEDHQTGKSILNEIPNFGLVTNTPLDYMHLVCLGMMKKLLWLWLKGPNNTRLGSRTIGKMSKILQSFQRSCPNDFVRKPQGLKHALQWKATEYREFLLYTGAIVLKDYLLKYMYVHFLTLHVAITILVNSILITQYLDYARNLLEYFVISFSIIYGKKHITYNIHNMLHICTDVEKFGPLDMFSAFRFENYMSTIKRHLRKNERPLEQLARRHEEKLAIRDGYERINKQQRYEFSFKNVYVDGPLCDEIRVKVQYKRCSNELYEIHCKDKKNNACILKDGTAIVISNIIESYDNRAYVIGIKLISLGNIYSSPLASSILRITVVTKDVTLGIYPISEIAGKLWLLSYKNKQIIFPLLHT